jgi:predicted dehydrogenase
MAGKPVMRVAMVGYAFMGAAHSQAWRNAHRFFDLPAVPEPAVLCGRDADAVAAAASRMGWADSATDWREVVTRDDIDIVDISSPGDTHRDIAIAALEAGKHVLCEKPLSNTVAEAEEMTAAAQAAERRGVWSMVAFNYRRTPALALARRLVAEGRLGRLHHIRAQYLQDWIVDPEFPLVWRLQKDKAGSGALGDIAAHSIDLARFLVGEITEVCGELKTFITARPLPDNPKRKGRVTVDDASTALVRFANGAIGTIEATRMAPGRKNFNRFEINGSRGSLAFDLERMNELDLYLDSDKPSTRGFRRILVTESGHPYMKAWWPPGHIIGYEHTFTHTVFDLLEGMAAGRSPKPDFEDGVRNQRVLGAIEKAAVSRRWIAVKDVH